jgi:hypothetical protein
MPLISRITPIPMPTGGGCEAGYRDIRAPDSRRIRTGKQQNRQPDVPQHEPEQASGERHVEAPDADACECECVHSLEYVP